jgi:hypothetical protein
VERPLHEVQETGWGVEGGVDQPPVERNEERREGYVRTHPEDYNPPLGEMPNRRDHAPGDPSEKAHPCIGLLANLLGMLDAGLPDEIIG